MLKNKKEIINWLKKYEIEKYIINEDLTVYVDGNVNLYRKKLKTIPVKFVNINGYLDCSLNYLTSLENFPEEIKGSFDCSNNELTSLKFSPNKINGYFDCSGNQLTSLEYCPKKINGIFNCSENNLKSLEYCPEEIGGNFDCSGNQLTSLEYCSEKINGKFDCSYNQLTSLKYCPQEINGVFDCSNNKLTDLLFLPKLIKADLYIQDNSIRSNFLYLFNSNITGEIFSDFGNKEEFLLLVQEQKILFEKEMINNNLENKNNSHLDKKRL